MPSSRGRGPASLVPLEEEELSLPVPARDTAPPLGALMPRSPAPLVPLEEQQLSLPPTGDTAPPLRPLVPRGPAPLVPLEQEQEQEQVSLPVPAPTGATPPRPLHHFLRRGIAETRRARTALFFVLVVALFTTANAALHPSDECKMLKDACSKSATTLDTVFSVIGFIGSGLILLFPGWRLWCMFRGPEDIVNDRLFMGFLLIGTLSYAAWVGYAFRECGYCDATPYVKGISILGCACNCFFSLIGLFGHKGRLTGEGKFAFIVIFVSIGGLLSTASYNSAEASDWEFVAFAVVAQFCRILSTDYANFSKIQFCVSIIGAACGFLCLRHPHVVAVDPYWRSVFSVAIVRLVEFVIWFLAYFGINLTPRSFFKYALDRLR